MPVSFNSKASQEKESTSDCFPGNVRSSHEAFALPDNQSVISNYDFSGKGVLSRRMTPR
jgi:hypothetical protein